MKTKGSRLSGTFYNFIPQPFQLNPMATGKLYDVIIVGGSYSGLSAAMALGRALRNVLIIDGNEPCNRQTPHSHNFLTQDGSTPEAIATLARQQVKNLQGRVSATTPASLQMRLPAKVQVKGF